MLACFHFHPRLLVCFLAVVGSASTTQADEFRFEPIGIPAPLLRDGKTDAIIEASGVEPIEGGRRLLIAHDKHPALVVADLATGQMLGDPITSPRFPAPGTSGPKWEGMARDSAGNFYVIGAHNGKTEKERASKSVLLRFRLRDGAEPAAIDDASVVRWTLNRSLVEVLSAAGLEDTAVGKRKIEGLAIRERKVNDGSIRRELAIGLREPSDRVRAFVADITHASPDAELDLKPLFTFQADAREGVTSQLTSLEYAEALGGFLVVTASEDGDNAFHGNTLWFLADGQSSEARKIATFEVAMKAEGLAVLDATQANAQTTVRLLITYDNDAHTTHIPSRFQTVRLIRSRSTH